MSPASTITLALSRFDKASRREVSIRATLFRLFSRRYTWVLIACLYWLLEFTVVGILVIYTDLFFQADGVAKPVAVAGI